MTEHVPRFVEIHLSLYTLIIKVSFMFSHAEFQTNQNQSFEIIHVLRPLKIINENSNDKRKPASIIRWFIKPCNDLQRLEGISKKGRIGKDGLLG